MFLRKRARSRSAKESVLYGRHPHGGIAACPVYPNIYRLAMANTGLQAVYQIFDHDQQGVNRTLIDRRVWVV